MPDQEPIYNKQDLMAAASAFGTKPEIIAGAIALAQKTEFTKAEFETALKTFLERTV